MNKYLPLIEIIAKRSGVEFRPASENDLDSLRSLGLAGPVVEFFSEFEPSKCVDDAERLWPITEIVVENTELVPGCNILQHGFVVFATTLSGDAYCFDLNNVSPDGDPEIVFMSHEEDYELMAPDAIMALSQPIAKNLLEFLDMFARDAFYDD